MEGKSPLKNRVFVFTGEMSMPRDEACNLVVALGGRTTKAVSGKTTHLVVGSEPGESKVSKAKELEVKIIDADAFFKMIDGAKSVLETVITTNINNESIGSTKNTANSVEERCENSTIESITENEQHSLKGNKIPWAEKYRPRNVGDLVGNPGV
ncbi:hypothetical protein PAEPH01_2685, partial [Pancytospora epiphaga]